MKEPVDTEIRKRSIVTPFIIGGLVGAGLALLFAPKSGKELRKSIKDLAETSGDTVGTLIGKGKDLLDENKSSMKRAVEAAKAAYIEERERQRQVA